jgi:hypothetical protein
VIRECAPGVAAAEFVELVVRQGTKRKAAAEKGDAEPDALLAANAERDDTASGVQSISLSAACATSPAMNPARPS